MRLYLAPQLVPLEVGGTSESLILFLPRCTVWDLSQKAHCSYDSEEFVLFQSLKSLLLHLSVEVKMYSF